MTSSHAAPRVSSLIAAELRRASRRRSARVIALAGPLAAAMGVAVSLPPGPTGVDAGLAALDGWRGAIAFGAAVLAAAWAGGWQASGTAAEVLSWFGRRISLALVATAGTAVVAAACALLVWVGALVGLAAGTAVGEHGGDGLAAVGLVGMDVLGASGAVAVAVGAGAVIGAGLGTAVASPVGALAVLGTLLVVVEPVLYSVRADVVALRLAMPIDALTVLAGTAGPPGAVASTSGFAASGLASALGPTPWVVALGWVAGTVALAVATFARREL